MSRIFGATAVIVTVILAAVAQIIIKQQLSRLGPAPFAINEWPGYALTVLLSWQILLGFALAFIGAMIYLFAISRFDVTYLYPFASMSFPAVLLLGVFVLGEPLSWQKAAGSALIIFGVIISATSQS